MTPELKELSVEDFERELIASSKLDTQESPSVDDAWHRFVSLTSSVVVSAESLSGVHRVREHNTQVDAPSATVESSAASNLGAPNLDAGSAGNLTTPVSSVRGVALKWGGLGTIAGALLTGGVLRIAQPEAHSRAPSGSDEPMGTHVSPTATAQTLVSEAPKPRVQISQARVTETSVTQTSVPPGAKSVAASTRVAAPHDITHERAQKGARSAAPNAHPNSVEAPSLAAGSRAYEPPSLAAEVRLVDNARQALLASDLSVAQDLIQTYRRKFPNGALTADIAYLEIKVAKARGKDTLWRSHARRFIAAFPRDPHHQQVLELLSNAK
jgi:hypothetical protein